MVGSVSALGSSIALGVSDFLAGTTSRRVGMVQVAVVTQVIGLALAAVWTAASRQPVPPEAAAAAAAGAGLSVTVGLTALFQAMVIGQISVVAPISAMGVALPVAAGIVRGERPTAAQAVGIVAAIAGVVSVSRTPGGGPAERHQSGLGLALLAAFGSGLFLWLIAPASRHGLAWSLLISRAVPAVLLTAAAAIRRTSLQPVLNSKTAGRILSAALLGFAGQALYAFATVHGELAIVSVLGSLYPGVTVLLAYRLLGERLAGAQRLGVAALLGGIALLSV